ncbi:hypothetical protein ILUMI_08573 [Ignelater luminosus]|uniref:Calponin-homology (CH) domain-containing protein n=1 Tax=Ignelater luminosus TaxID=2038154 RepID=A0A8K0D449_IGNLU|nr:hypothetical protein ILUMI_08573 [Ignelater luminosus]
MGGRSLESDVAGLYKWIDNYPLTRQKRNIHRDFSDAIPLAEILKYHYPKLVELHNYTPRNSVSQKLDNWQTLNRKVLNKLDMTLSTKVMEQLAHSMPGAIEKVLFDIKQKIEAKNNGEDRPSDDVYFIEGLSASISGSIIPIKAKNGTKPLDHKVIPIDTFTRMESELEEKNEAIRILKNKLQHLESLLQIKDERINDLTRQLQQNSGVTSQPSLLKSPKFLNNLF